MAGDEKSGIARAIAIAGNQAGLSRLIWERCHVHIWQARISEYERAGYAPLGKARLISDATGIPISDLVRQDKRENRRVSRRKQGHANV